MHARAGLTSDSEMASLDSSLDARDLQALALRAEALLATPAQACASACPSPCVSVCRMIEGAGLCAGCLRTLDEIAAWSGLDDGGRRAVWQRIGERARRPLHSPAQAPDLRSDAP